MNARGIRSRTPTGYYRCIPFRDQDRRETGSAQCWFPSPWRGVTSEERRKLQQRWDEYYRQYPGLAEFKPKEPGWWRTGRREPRNWTLAQQRRAKRLWKHHRAGWWNSNAIGLSDTRRPT